MLMNILRNYLQFLMAIRLNEKYTAKQGATLCLRTLTYDSVLTSKYVLLQVHLYDYPYTAVRLISSPVQLTVHSGYVHSCTEYFNKRKAQDFVRLFKCFTCVNYKSARGCSVLQLYRLHSKIK